MKNTLIDAGPLIALFNKNDKHHERVIRFLKKYEGEIITTWPVITETTHMLSYNVNTQIDFLKWIQRGGINIEEILIGDLERIIKLSEKYSNVPMDLADASLLVISERKKIQEIITIDSDYYIYRTENKEMLINLLEEEK